MIFDNSNVLSAGAGLAQLVIVSSTLLKLIARRRLGWGRTPLTSLMLKQGLSTFLMVLGGPSWIYHSLLFIYLLFHLALLAVMITYAAVLDIDVDTGDAVLSYVTFPFTFCVRK